MDPVLFKLGPEILTGPEDDCDVDPHDYRTRAIVMMFVDSRKLTMPMNCELELELIQSHMTQRPMLRGEVGARALRV